MSLDLFAGPAGRTDDAATLAALEVDYTPIPVALQLTITLLHLVASRWASRPTVRVADPSVGSGAWARAMRAVLGARAHITGIEPRASERDNLRAACDAHYIGLLEDAARHKPPQRFDLVASNPPFTSFARNWPGLLFDAGWLADDAVVALYGLTQWGQSADSIPALQSWCPRYQIRCAGRVAHREDGKADSREYCLWVWCVEDRGHRPFPSWTTVQVPTVLATERRRWRLGAEPGLHPIEPAMVEQIRKGLGL